MFLVLFPLLIFQWLCIYQERGQRAINFFLLIPSYLTCNLFSITDCSPHPLWTTPRNFRMSFLSRKSELAPHWAYCQNRKCFLTSLNIPSPFTLATALYIYKSDPSFLYSTYLLPVPSEPLHNFVKLNEECLLPLDSLPHCLLIYKTPGTMF